MTTYELPPEPPVGSRVRDHSGREWVRDASIGWKSSDESRVTIVGGWMLLIGYHGPLTLIPDPEPDPWPTAPLIVATLDTDGPRTVYMRNGDAYESTDNWVQADTDIPLTNVVPVTVVPTERVDYLSAAHASWVAGAIDDKTMIGYAIGLLESLDGLGLGQ